jgi:hypothetical protein
MLSNIKPLFPIRFFRCLFPLSNHWLPLLGKYFVVQLLLLSLLSVLLRLLGLLFGSNDNSICKASTMLFGTLGIVSSFL